MKLFYSDDRVISTKDFVDKLKPYVQKGDALYVATDLSRFGTLYDPMIKKEKFLNAIFDIFKELVGLRGSIILPAFSYSWGVTSPHKVFDYKTTPCKTGVLPQFFIKNNLLIRTQEPMFSVLLWGDNTDFFSDIGSESFGKRSIFEKMHKVNAKIMNFGTKSFDPTYIHYVEEYFDKNIKKLYYRKQICFDGKFINKHGITVKGRQTAFMRELNSPYQFTDSKMVKSLEGTKDYIFTKIGSGNIYVSDAKTIFDVGIEGLKNDPLFFVTDMRC